MDLTAVYWTRQMNLSQTFTSHWTQNVHCYKLMVVLFWLAGYSLHSDCWVYFRSVVVYYYLIHQPAQPRHICSVCVHTSVRACVCVRVCVFACACMRVCARESVSACVCDVIKGLTLWCGTSPDGLGSSLWLTDAFSHASCLSVYRSLPYSTLVPHSDRPALLRVKGRARRDLHLPLTPSSGHLPGLERN